MEYKSKFKAAEIDEKLGCIYVLSEELSRKWYDYALSSEEIKKIVDEVTGKFPMMFIHSTYYGFSMMCMLCHEESTDDNGALSSTNVHCITPWYDSYAEGENKVLESVYLLSYDYTTQKGVFEQLQ